MEVASVKPRFSCVHCPACEERIRGPGLGYVLLLITQECKTCLPKLLVVFDIKESFFVALIPSTF